MVDLVDAPEGAHKLIDLCTRVVIDWLKAQHKAMGDAVEGIFILDDVVGMIGKRHYREFAHPYLKRICDAFPAGWVKLYHNDADVGACLDLLPEAGFNMLNWGKQRDVREVKRRVGQRMCLMGNVNPLEIAVRGTPAEVKRSGARRAGGLRGRRHRSLRGRRNQPGHAALEHRGHARGAGGIQLEPRGRRRGAAEPGRAGIPPRVRPMALCLGTTRNAE
jgi:hypothetical protein